MAPDAAGGNRPGMDQPQPIQDGAFHAGDTLSIRSDVVRQTGQGTTQTAQLFDRLVAHGLK